jgi:hypothetical protein
VSYNLDKCRQDTADAMSDPQVGDRFHDMYTFWVYVVDAGSESVTTYEASGHPSQFPDVGGKLRFFPTRQAFRASYQYGSIPGYFVRLSDRGNDVSGWVRRVTDLSLSVSPEEKP